MKTKEEMLRMLAVLTDEDRPYPERLEAYEYLLEDCDEIVDDMLEKFYVSEGETGKMLIEILAGYKGNPAIYMGLVSYLYKGEDVALFARLLGSYGDERAIDLLKGFAEEYELNYNEYMEVRNAVEQLGGYFDDDKDYSDDPFYRYLKGLDEPETDSRRSPFENIFAPAEGADAEDGEDDGCGCDDDCDCEDDECDDDGCDCHHHRHG
ncbi:MAG TPA: hypothetical protein IAD51_03720 [Candidatus Limadaptatus stercorigallinarum]|uniref:Uncharacterized protein n=1 Tax=Candidatus Limadaptatus stercorigallinarum TaxID=2840845 RepID=A0A9D1HS66_9FIRM|nr:hypothetical protein [Candidatus Limadaptatus stercorigallinarum]